MTIVRERGYSVQEFERFLNLPENRDRLLEFINGEIIEKMPTEEHGVVAGNIIFALRSYVQQHKSGRVGVEVRHQMPDHERNLRLPDVSYSSTRRPLVREGSIPEMPDLAVEIQSPDESIDTMREKATYYLNNGARLVWLISLRKMIIEVHHPETDFEILSEHEILSGGDVLPGFSMPVADVFEDPLEA